MVGHSRTRARALVIISTCVLALVLLLATTVRAGSGSASGRALEYRVEEHRVEEHRVEAGDTLWEIAAERTSRGGDVRSTVASITDLNDLTSSLIRPGQLLLVPEVG